MILSFSLLFYIIANRCFDLFLPTLIMKPARFIILLQAILSLLSGYLISKMSLIGRIGINLMYSEYIIFKSWWQTALLLFGIQSLLLGVQFFVKKRKGNKLAFRLSLVLLVIALFGLYTTYHDFQHTISHKLLKEKFHLGFYLFWLTWIGGCLFCMSRQPFDKIVAYEMRN